MERLIVNLSDIDITETTAFDGYTELKDELVFELENRPFYQTWLPQEKRDLNQEISSFLETIPPETLKSKADTLIETQGLKEKNLDLIEYMSNRQATVYPEFSNLWNPIVWQSREDTSRAKVNVNNHIMDAFDLDYMIAENLQQIYAGEDPKAEYYDWIKRQKQIELDINTNGTTEEEVVARNVFIGFLNDRESEIRRIITLYSGAAFNSKSMQQRAAQEKLKFLTFKLSELRRLREKTQSLKSHADQKKEIMPKQNRLRRTVAYASDFVATASLASIYAPIAARINRFGRPISPEEEIDVKRKIQQHREQLDYWRKYLLKLRGIESSQEPDEEEEYQNEPLTHEEIQRQQGFSAELYRQQMDSRNFD